MPYYPPYDHEKKTEILSKLKSSKITVEEICATYNVKENTVASWACERGLSLRGRREKVQKKKEMEAKERYERNVEIIEKLLSNVSLNMGGIAEVYGLTRERIRQILVEHGFLKLYHKLSN